MHLVHQRIQYQQTHSQGAVTAVLTTGSARGAELVLPWTTWTRHVRTPGNPLVEMALEHTGWAEPTNSIQEDMDELRNGAGWRARTGQ